MTINSKTLQELTGLSTRRLYHWVDSEVIPEEYVVSGRHPGTGRQLEFDESVIEPVKLLIKIADWISDKSSGSGISTKSLRQIFDAYSDGGLVFTPGVALGWALPVNDNKKDDI